jgi:putative membrane protein
MALVHLRKSDADALTAAVGRAESTTSAEVVLVVLPRVVRPYPAAIASAAVFGAVALAVLLFGDFDADELIGVPGTLMFAALGFALVWRTAPLSLVTRAKTRKRAVDDAAHAAFSRHGVHRTRGRTGILLFVASAEQEVRVLADVGVVAAVPDTVRAGWSRALLAAHTAADVALAVESIGRSAGSFLPRADDDIDELPNAPQLEAS